MIKTRKFTPEIYNKGSRDFQLLGSLYDTLFNNVKTNIDNISFKNLSKDTNPLILQLLLTTYGFNCKHTYENSTLYAAVVTFNSVVKNKGSLDSIKEVVKLLINSQYCEPEYSIIEDKDKKELKIILPSILKDTIFLEDMLDYILPAGWIYSLASSVDFKEEILTTETLVSEVIRIDPTIDVDKEHINEIDSTKLTIGEIVINN